jgi:hypothetical protein
MTGYTKLVAYTVVGLIASACAFLFLVRPALDQVTKLSEEEGVTKAEIHRLEQQILAYKTAQSDLSKATNKDQLFNTFVDDKNLSIPIEELESKAKITGTTYELKINREFITEPQADTRKATTVRSAAPLKTVTIQKELEEVPYTLTVTNSSYENLVTFVKYLEHIPHFTEVSKMRLAPVEGEGATGVAATIDGVFLVKKDATQAR